VKLHLQQLIFIQNTMHSSLSTRIKVKLLDDAPLFAFQTLQHSALEQIWYLLWKSSKADESEAYTFKARFHCKL
jgi:hypothetical protein